MVWYYPYKSKDEWVSAKLCDLNSFDRLISSGTFTDDDIDKYVRITLSSDDNSFMQLLQYTYKLHTNGNDVAAKRILKVISKISSYDDDATNTSFTTSDRDEYKIARLFRMAYGTQFLDMYQTYKPEYFLAYAKAIITVYTILNGTGDYFDVEYVAELYKDFLASKLSNEAANSPIGNFIRSRATGNYDMLFNDVFKVLECIVNTEKHNQLISDITELCHSDKDRISKICDLIYVYSDNDGEGKSLSNFEKSLILDSFLDLYKGQTSTDDAYREIKICLDNMSHSYGCKMSSDTMDAINAISSKSKSIQELRRKNNIEDVDINEIVDSLLPANWNIDDEIEETLCMLEKEHEESMRNPATEANKVDYSKYDWDDDSSKSESQEESDDSKPEKTTTKSTSTKRSKSSDDDVPNYGKAKLKGMEKGIKRSANLHKVTSKVSNEYMRYKQQEQKIDSQVSKIVVNAAKTVTGTDDNTVRRRIVGRDRFSVVKVLKRIIATYGIFCWSKIGALCLIIVRIATGKFVTDRERRKIISELEQEIEIVEEKISDARGADDKEAKYALMRTKNNLENAVKKIKYGKGKWNQITLGGIKDAKASISKARGEE